MNEPRPQTPDEALVTLDGRALPCGRLAGEVLDAVIDPGYELDAHQRACPHCGQELAALARSWALVETAASTPVQIPAGALDRVVEDVRSRIHRPGRSRQVAHHPTGAVRVSESVLVDMARAAAQSVEGVGAVAVAGRLVDTTMDVEVVLAYGEDLAAAAERIRRRVTQTVDALAGVPLERVGVHIVDVTAG